MALQCSFSRSFYETCLWACLEHDADFNQAYVPDDFSWEELASFIREDDTKRTIGIDLETIGRFGASTNGTLRVMDIGLSKCYNDCEKDKQCTFFAYNEDLMECIPLHKNFVDDTQKFAQNCAYLFSNAGNASDSETLGTTAATVSALTKKVLNGFYIYMLYDVSFTIYNETLSDGTDDCICMNGGFVANPKMAGSCMPCTSDIEQCHDIAILTSGMTAVCTNTVQHVLDALDDEQASAMLVVMADIAVTERCSLANSMNREGFEKATLLSLISRMIAEGLNAGDIEAFLALFEMLSDEAVVTLLLDCSKLDQAQIKVLLEILNGLDEEDIEGMVALMNSLTEEGVAALLQVCSKLDEAQIKALLAILEELSAKDMEALLQACLRLNEAQLKVLLAILKELNPPDINCIVTLMQALSDNAVGDLLRICSRLDLEQTKELLRYLCPNLHRIDNIEALLSIIVDIDDESLFALVSLVALDTDCKFLADDVPFLSAGKLRAMIEDFCQRFNASCKRSGAPCATSTECASGACGVNETCLHSDGEVCIGDHDCASGACTADVCLVSNGNACASDKECSSSFCNPKSECSVLPAHCSDGIRSANETDLDCGADCRQCTGGHQCQTTTDCISAVCKPVPGLGPICLFFDLDPCMNHGVCVSGVCGSDMLCLTSEGQSCTNDNACASGSCGTNSTCLLLGGTRCSQATECASGACGVDQTCLHSDGEVCIGDHDCASGACAADVCLVSDGQTCLAHDVCASSVCGTTGKCSGGAGSECVYSTDCISRKCDYHPESGGVCEGRPFGAACAIDIECHSRSCDGFRCTDPWRALPCTYAQVNGPVNFESGHSSSEALTSMYDDCIVFWDCDQNGIFDAVEAQCVTVGGGCYLGVEEASLQGCSPTLDQMLQTKRRCRAVGPDAAPLSLQVDLLMRNMSELVCPIVPVVTGNSIHDQSKLAKKRESVLDEQQCALCESHSCQQIEEADIDDIANLFNKHQLMQIAFGNNGSSRSVSAKLRYRI
jgi:hypothetical protein